MVRIWWPSSTCTQPPTWVSISYWTQVQRWQPWYRSQNKAKQANPGKSATENNLIWLKNTFFREVGGPDQLPPSSWTGLLAPWRPISSKWHLFQQWIPFSFLAWNHEIHFHFPPKEVWSGLDRQLCVQAPLPRHLRCSPHLHGTRLRQAVHWRSNPSKKNPYPLIFKSIIQSALRMEFRGEQWTSTAGSIRPSPFKGEIGWDGLRLKEIGWIDGFRLKQISRSSRWVGMDSDDHWPLMGQYWEGFCPQQSHFLMLLERFWL